MSSAQHRARQTCAALLHEPALSGVAVRYLPTLNDLSYGECEEQTPEEVRATLPNTLRTIQADPYNNAWPNGESVRMLFETRLEQHIHEIHSIDRDVLIVAHAPVIQGLLHFFNDEPEGQLASSTANTAASAGAPLPGRRSNDDMVMAAAALPESHTPAAGEGVASTGVSPVSMAPTAHGPSSCMVGGSNIRSARRSAGGAAAAGPGAGRGDSTAALDHADWLNDPSRALDREIPLHHVLRLTPRGSRRHLDVIDLGVPTTPSQMPPPDVGVRHAAAASHASLLAVGGSNSRAPSMQASPVPVPAQGVIVSPAKLPLGDR